MSEVRAFAPDGFGAWAWVTVVERKGDELYDSARVQFKDGSEAWLTNNDLDETRVCENCSIPLSYKDEGRNCRECVEMYAIPDWENER